MRCIVDSSFAATWFLPDEKSPAGQKIFDAFESGQFAVDAPHLFVYEMANLFLISLRRKRFDKEGFQEAKDIFEQLRFEYHDQTDFVCRRRIFSFAEKHLLTAYDAAYLELADRLQIPLLSHDEALRSAAKKENLQISII